MTGYALIVDLLINIDFYATFGIVTPYIQIVFIIIGLIMFLMLLFKIERFKNSFTYLKLRKYDAPINYYSCEQPKNVKRSPI
jgi:Ni,Fe-hydrogenase I cytochrome b subunit